MLSKQRVKRDRRVLLKWWRGGPRRLKQLKKIAFIRWRNAARDGRQKRSREYVIDRVLVYKHVTVALVLFEECMKRVLKRRLVPGLAVVDSQLLSAVRRMRVIRVQHVTCITDRCYLQYGLDTLDNFIEELSNDWQTSEDCDVWLGCTMLFSTRRNFKRVLETTTLNGLSGMIALENPLNVSTVLLRNWCVHTCNYQGFVMIDLKHMMSVLQTLDLSALCDEVQRYTISPSFTHTLVEYVMDWKSNA
jgi:hypothetical protein